MIQMLFCVLMMWMFLCVGMLSILYGSGAGSVPRPFPFRCFSLVSGVVVPKGGTLGEVHQTPGERGSNMLLLAGERRLTMERNDAEGTGT